MQVHTSYLEHLLGIQWIQVKHINMKKVSLWRYAPREECHTTGCTRQDIWKCMFSCLILIIFVQLAYLHRICAKG